MEKRSIKINAVCSLIQSVCAIIFPLITFPYISRIFGVEQLGKYNYAKNFVEIFAVIAILGIPTYGQREGAKVRDDKEKINELMSQLFSLSMLANLITLIALFAATFLVAAFRTYALLIAIFSITIPMTTIGMSWLFVVYEDYNFSTLIGIGFNLLSVIAMLALVKNPNDIYIYALITVIASCGSNMIKFLYGRRYCSIRLVRCLDFRKHMGPVLLMFSVYISVMIYNRTDTALLGIMASDYHVGIYSVSTKVYNLVKSCLLALSNVLQTRAVLLAAKEDRRSSDLFLSKSLNMMMTFVVPCTVGMAFMHEDIILFISGKAYEEAGTSMIILSVSLFFALFSTMHSSCILIPHRREKTTLNGAMIGAIENLILNFFFIPVWKENGAAFTTLIAEITVFLIYHKVTKKYYTHINGIKTFVQCVVGSLGIIAVLFFLQNMKANIIVKILIKTGLSAVVYFILQIVFKNEIVIELIRGMTKNKKV
ncbi:MAG: flippase [Hungatella sp.]|nr:flippase [Hungatella sp.]